MKIFLALYEDISSIHIKFDLLLFPQHCMKGWNTNQPSTMPSSSNIALRDSTAGLKTAMKTVSGQSYY